MLYTSPAELQKAYHLPTLAIATRVYDAVDADGDGELSADEYQAWLDAMLQPDEEGADAAITFFLGMLQDLLEGATPEWCRRKVVSCSGKGDAFGGVTAAELQNLLQGGGSGIHSKLDVSVVNAIIHKIFANMDDTDTPLQRAVAHDNPLDHPDLMRMTTADELRVVLHTPMSLGYLRSTFKATFSPPSKARGRGRGGGDAAAAPWNPNWWVYGLLHLAMIAACIGRTFHWRSVNPDLDHIPALAVARGSGFSIMLATVFLYLTKSQMISWLVPHPMLRSFFTWTGLHAHAGVITFGYGCIHTFTHFYWQEDTAFDTDRIVNTKRDLADDTHVGFSPAWLTGTGIILMLILLAMSFTGTRRVQNKAAYRTFLNWHHLYYLYLPLLIAHAPYRWYVFGPLLVIVAINELMKFRNTYEGSMERCRRIGDSTSLVALASHRGLGGLPTIAGSYYRVNIPAISMVEWHPFSLCSSEIASCEEFLIKDLGKWTNALGKLLDDKEVDLRRVRLRLQGPFYAPAVHAVEEENPLLVAAGVGITPFLSLCHRLVFRHAASDIEVDRNVKCFGEDKELAVLLANQLPLKNEDVFFNCCKTRIGKEADDTKLDQEHQFRRPTVLIWVVRDFSLVDYFLAYIVSLMRMQDTSLALYLEVEVYFTGVGKAGVDAMVLNTFMAVHFNALCAGVRGLTIKLGRPNLTKIIADTKPSASFYCGAPRIGAAFRDACDAASVPMYEEEFQDATLGRWWEEAKPKLKAKVSRMLPQKKTTVTSPLQLPRDKPPTLPDKHRAGDKAQPQQTPEQSVRTSDEKGASEPTETKASQKSVSFSGMSKLASSSKISTI